MDIESPIMRTLGKRLLEGKIFNGNSIERNAKEEPFKNLLLFTMILFSIKLLIMIQQKK